MKPSPERLFHDNLRLAYHFGNRWAQRLAGVLEPDDVLQLAMLGLWQACLAWDPDRGQLSTLASACIRNECLRAAYRERRALAKRTALPPLDRLALSTRVFPNPETAALLSEAASRMDPLARAVIGTGRQQRVAQASGVSQVTVSRRWIRARRELEAVLA